MAEKTEKKTRQNSVHVVGYLKENTLEVVKTEKGEAIRGSMVIATSDVSSHKIQFFTYAKTKNGDDSADFEALSELLPDKTTSIASFLKNNPGSTFEIASNASSKVWVMARFEEFASKVGERTKTMVLLKGFKAGFKTATDASPFVPRAEFVTDIFIKSIKPEMINETEDNPGEATGRYLIEGLMPMYDESVQLVDFIAPCEGGVAQYMSANFAKGDTVTIKGEVISMVNRILKGGAEDENEFFGEAPEPQYETVFVRERIIKGLSKKPIKQGEENCISLDSVKAGMAKRETKMIENGKRAKANEQKQAETVKQAQPPKSDQTTADDIDF